MSNTHAQDRPDGGPDTVAHNRRCALELARALCGGRPTEVVVSPGSRCTPLTLAFDALPEAHLSVVLDERAAAFVALGAARASGRPAIALCTSGSAGTHYGPACVEAAYARLPLILLTANRPPELQHCGAPQTIAQDQLLPEPLRLRMSLPVADAAVSGTWLRQIGARARAAACGSPAGPVHLDVPFREPLWSPPTDSIPLPKPVPFEAMPLRTLPDDATLDRAARQLRHARGVIVCGPQVGPLASAAAMAAQRLAVALGWPLLHEATSGLTSADPQAVRVTRGGALLRCDAFAELAQAEAAVLVGQTPTSKPLRHWLARMPERGVAIDPDGWLQDPTGCTGQLLGGDVAAILDALRQRAGRAAVDAEWLGLWQRAEACAARVLAEHAAEGAWEGRVAHDLTAALAPNTMLFVGSSMPIRDLNDFGDGLPRTVLANRGCNGIDGGVATAGGLALASGRPALAWLGDLALLHDLDGLEAAGAAGWPLTLLVVDNRGGGIFEQLPIAQHPQAFERLFVTPRVARLGPLCAALGASHRRVDLAGGGLPDAIGEARRQGGLQLLEVTVDRQHSVARRRQAWQALDEAIRAQLSNRAQRNQHAPRIPAQSGVVAQSTRRVAPAHEPSTHAHAHGVRAAGGGS